MLPNIAIGNHENKTQEEVLIANALRQLSLDELKQHKLLGFAASRRVNQNYQSPVYEARLLENIQRELVACSVINELGKRLFTSSKVEVGLLKGAALWGDLYFPGERQASDIDLFVNENNLQYLLLQLSQMGFQKQHCAKGRISNFKTVCLSEDYGDLSIEVHTKIWWQEPEEFQWNWRPALISPFNRLSLEDQLIHLCGHWGAQHTMISLHWLLDIALFCNRYAASIDHKILSRRAQQLRLSRSVAIACELARSIFSNSTSDLHQTKIDFEFLRAPKKNRFKYYWLKHHLQDSIYGALKYDFFWLTAGVQNFYHEQTEKKRESN